MYKIKKNRIWLIFTICLILLAGYSYSVFNTNYYRQLDDFKSEFKAQEKALDKELNSISKKIDESGSLSVNELNDKFYIHIYKNDTLINWNTNQIPISNFADLHFPTNGIKKAQNGWYYVKTIQKNNLIIVGSFQIKREYAYQNNQLQNDYAKPFNTNFQSFISLDESSGFPIYSEKGQYLFSVFATDYQPIKDKESIILMCLLIATITLFIWQISSHLIKLKTNWAWAFPLGIIIIRYLSLKFNWFYFMQNSTLFKPSLYGTSSIFPNFFEYTLNIFLIFIIVHFNYKRIKTINRKYPIFISCFFISILYFAWLGVIYLSKGLIENSSIPMDIEKLFQLNIYSFLSILSIALLGFTFFICGKTIITFNINQGINFKKNLIYNIIVGIIFLIIDYYFINKLPYTLIFAIIFISFISILEYKEFKQKHLIIGMTLLAQYALICSLIIGDFSNRKDKSERELYANQLVIERDLSTELEYNSTEKSLLDDKFLQRMISSGKQINHRDFEEGLERRHFNGFWEKYECAFYIFKENKESISISQNNTSEKFEELSNLIHFNSEQSEINKSIYFIKDYSEQYSYIIRQNLFGKNGEKAILFITLKSKKLPEEIGFPRLLISSQTMSLQHLENYSIAKYHNNRLVSKYGNFNYPTNYSIFRKVNVNRKNNFDYNGYNHFVHYKTGKDIVILSGINNTTIDTATSFSYLFCLFGLLILPIYIKFYSTSLSRKTLALSVKIQIALIGLVLVSLLASGLGSGIFVKKQYQEYSEFAIKDKTHSVELDLKAKVGKIKSLNIHENGALLNFQLINLSKIYNTDINLYDPNGYLIATSRQKIFNYGLLSEQINPIAKRELHDNAQSDFVHQENIGLLNYSSAYSPLFNNSGKLLGYINLQHFGQQDEIEYQIQQFLVSVINIFVLLLALSAITAIFVANWITNPLQMLQERFSKINLKESNQRISYNLDDEIGDLVKSYNQKIEELEVAAQQIAQNERESAWRDMAKQVAHEIKNPLTPMKLSVQHLMRSFDPNDEKSTEKINKVSQSLVEQIDALTKIANEFSNFAKMPKPIFEDVDLTQIINNSVEVFIQSSSTKIETELPNNCIIKGDKEQLLRVFNNLIKNSIQAINEKEEGIITINLKEVDQYIKITITDNGMGMNEEQKNKIFTPYFTTKSTGSGIGLSMVKQIILNHNGTINFDSTENVGTTFTIEINNIQA